ncbi:MAG: SpoIIE family protein phosphatase [Oscillospiraceae bacterium]|nr:SpoIIE family protein phosphatase [Oscillospiraceae bacterium]
MKQKRRRIIIQVAILFLIGALSTGLMAFFSETRLSDESVKRQMELHAAMIADESKRAVTEFPAYEWLLRYWYTHPETMEIEYDADYTADSRTAEKCRLFSGRHPELQLRYLEQNQVLTLPAEDQRLFAEIAYSWLITRINQIKQSYRADYLFCVISQKPFTQQFFLFSGADVGALRGTSYEEVYPLGNVVDVSESQTAAMREAVHNSSHLADAGNYVDYYASFCSFDGHQVLIGLTYDLSALKADIAAQTRKGATLAFLNQLVLSLICLILIFFFVLRPLKKMQKHIRGYKETKDSSAVAAGLAEVRSRNEIGRLAEDVSEMVREIDQHMEKIQRITAEKERIGTELALATRIQAAMLPRIFPPFPERKEFDIYASMAPAKEVGGDFYDFFFVDDDHLALVIADVSGKGVPAALFMMVSKILVKNYAAAETSPARILEAINSRICSNNPEQMFITVWLGILEISTGKLTASNAGHEYPVLRQADASFALFKDKHGFVIGGMEGVRYRDYTLQLEPGAKLFVYTDGVPEATDANGGFFGVGRMLDALNEIPDAGPVQLLRQVRRRVDDFVGDAEQFDDLTMLCLEYHGSGRSGAGKEITLPAVVENIPQVAAFVDAELEVLGCPAKAKMQIDVAIDELFGNIARYAYQPNSGEATVRFEAEDTPKAVILTFIDRGTPYDPLSAKEPDVTASAEDRPIGGLGVFLVRKTMDEVRYEFKDGKNILRIRKQL